MTFGPIEDVTKRQTLPGRAAWSLQARATSAFVRNVVSTFGARVFCMVLALGITVLTTRALGPEGRGLYAIAIAVGALGVQFGNLGLHASNIYSVARDRARLGPLLFTSLWVAAVVGCIIALLVWLTSVSLPRLALLPPHLLLLSLSAVPLGLGYLFAQSLLLGIDDVRGYNLIEMVTKLGSLGAVAVLVALDLLTVDTAVLLVLIGVASSSTWAVRRLRRRVVASDVPPLAVFRENLHYGLKAYLAALFSFLVIRSDLFMVKAMLGDRQAGFYSVAVTMTDMISTLAVVVGTLLFPKLSSMPDLTQRRRYAERVAAVVAAGMFAIALLSWLLASPVVHLLFGAAFMPAVAPFIALLPGIVFLCTNTIYMNYFAASGMPLITVYSPLAASIVNILLNIVAIPRIGIVGASLTSGVAYALMLGASMTFIRKQGRAAQL